jgi:hypothetical protein
MWEPEEFPRVDMRVPRRPLLGCGSPIINKLFLAVASSPSISDDGFMELKRSKHRATLCVAGCSGISILVRLCLANISYGI